MSQQNLFGECCFGLRIILCNFVTMKSELYKKVVFIGPDLKGKGGISTVMNEYRRVVHPFRSGSVNSRWGTMWGLFNLGLALVKIVGYRISGSRVLHINYAGQKSWKRENAIATYGRLLGYKTVMHCHCDLIQLDKNRGREEIVGKLSRADANIVLANSYRDFADKEVGLKRVSVIANFLSPVSSDFLLAVNTPPVFLFLGLLNEEKGFYDLLDACERLVSEGLDFKLVVGGEGDKARVDAAIAEKKLAKVVELRGWITGAEKEQAIRNADVLVLPSYSEGMPMVIIEALQAGCAVIGSDVGAIPDMLGKEIVGYVVKPGDVEGLAQSMATLIKNPDTLRRFRSDAVAVGRQYTADVVLPQLNEVYNTLLSRR